MTILLTSWNRIPIWVKLAGIAVFAHFMDLAITQFEGLAQMPHYQLMFRAALWLILGAAFVLEVGLRLNSFIIQFLLVLIFLFSALWKFYPQLLG